MNNKFPIVAMHITFFKIKFSLCDCLFPPPMHVQGGNKVGAEQCAPEYAAHDYHRQALFGRRSLSPSQCRRQHAEYGRECGQEYGPETYLNGFPNGFFRGHPLRLVAPGPVEKHDAMVQPDTHQGEKSHQAGCIQAHSADNQCRRPSGEGKGDLQQQQAGNQPAVELQHQNPDHEKKCGDCSYPEADSGLLEFGVQPAELDTIA